ncbi:AAA domain-containing protein [Actinoplanes sp. NPDC051851]|uniref:AAA domain-containing protein n=1 Tax=Actinoplanes sp. NPDC051851 TaxID=3154753 RepID=UPI00344010BE
MLVKECGSADRSRTVAEIAASAVAIGERVLVAGVDGAAVDEALSRLPAGLIVVREDAGGTGPRTPAGVASDVRQRALSRSQATARDLEPWLGDPSPAQGWLRRLDGALADADRTAGEAARIRAEWQAAAEAARERLSGAVEECRAARRDRERDLATATAEREWAAAHRLRRWWRAVRRALAGLRPAHGVPGKGVEKEGAAVEAACEELARVSEVLAVREAERDAAVAGDAGVKRALDRAELADVVAKRALEAAERAAMQLARLLEGLAPVPEWSADPAGLAEFAKHGRDVEPVLRARAALLRDWRQRMARPPEQLTAELVRYADVVGATCLGAGRPEFGDGAFDLVVIDGAESVPVVDALVALVRGRRAVLVGEVREPASEIGTASILTLVAG